METATHLRHPQREIFALTYDANGNLVSKSGPVSGTTSYNWDARNQLIQIASPSVTASFRYDARGRRIGRTVNGNTIGYLYDGRQAIAELRGNAVDTAYHTGLAIDEVLARYGSSGNKSLLTDALGSVMALANDDQSVQNFYNYSPYGQAQALGPDDGNSLQYTGRENDQMGLYFYRARYYDPVLKRFISEDPIGIDGGLNVYRYVNGNPLRYTDPSGQFGTGGYVGGVVFVAGALLTPYAAGPGIILMVVGGGLIVYSSLDDITEMLDKSNKLNEELQKPQEEWDKLFPPKKPEQACKP